MNRKQFRLLLAVGLIAGGVGFAAYRNTTSSWQGSTSSTGTLLGSFDLNTVNRLTIRDDSGTLNLALKNDLWVVEDRGDYPADWNKVKKFIQNLWELKPVQEVKAGPSQLPRLELIPPGGEKAAEGQTTGTLVELKNTANAPVASLLLGKRFLKKSEAMPGDGYPAGRYVMPLTKPGGSVSLISDTMESAAAKPEQWLNRDFFRVEKIRSVTAKGADGWTLSRENESATDWKLDGIKAEEKLATSQLPSFNSILGYPSFEDVFPPDSKAEGGKTVVAETFDGFTYTLTFGKAEGDQLPLHIAVAATLKKERTAPADEKPEEKEKADADFAAQLKKLEEKLAKEKKLENRVYRVSNGTFSPLFKPRGDLLEKKEEAKPK